MDFQKHKMDQDSHEMVLERHKNSRHMELDDLETDWDNYETSLREIKVEGVPLTSDPERLLVSPLSLAMPMSELTLRF